MTIKIYCQKCDGDGRTRPIWEGPCPKCSGKGYKEVPLDDLITPLVFLETDGYVTASAAHRLMESQRIEYRQEIEACHRSVIKSALNLDILK